MGLDQIGITLSGVIAVWLTQDERATWRRWACVFGMLAPAVLVLRGMEGRAVGYFFHVHALHVRVGQRPLDTLARPLLSGEEHLG